MPRERHPRRDTAPARPQGRPAKARASKARPTSDRAAMDRAAMERSIAEFLRAAGVPLDDPEVALTPSRVAAAWADEFLDGYSREPAEVLGTLSRAPAGAEIVFVTRLDYTGICPHHLLPYRGLAHVAYRPAGKVAGFSRVAALLDVLAHRLTLQEVLAQQVAEALVRGLGARGAGVILEAEQLCLTLRGEKRAHSRAAVEATAGRFDRRSLDRLWVAARAPLQEGRFEPRGD